jgi:hypothetical protein
MDAKCVEGCGCNRITEVMYYREAAIITKITV